MKKLVLSAALTGALLGLTGAASAQTAAPRLNEYYADPAHADIGGLWRPAPGQRVVFKVDGKPLPPVDAARHQQGFPYKPAWRKVVQARYAADAKGQPYGNPDDSCWPAGIIDDYLVRDDSNGFELIQTQGRVQMVFEYQDTIRWIFADGRDHMQGDDAFYSIKGDSIGKWDGDTFVVDTVHVRSEFTLGYNLPHSDQIHIVERFKRLDADTLQIDATITDPLALTKPVTATFMYKRSDPATLRERLCLEDNWNKVVGNDLVVRPDPRTKKRYGFDLPNPR
jgi:hypothetical protein